MQHIGEGQLDIPAAWHNHSVHIFTAQAPGMPGLSITINRDRLPFATTLQQYTQEQSGKLARQLKGYQLLGESALEVDGRPAQQFEFIWQTDDAGPMHQLLVCVAEGQRLLNLTASFGGRMNEQQVLETRRILHSFRFDPPADAAQAGAAEPVAPAPAAGVAGASDPGAAA